MSRVVVSMALVLAACTLWGCQAAPQQAASLYGGQGVHLFGPEPLALGLEDRGYFALAERPEAQISVFDFRSQYVRTLIWDVEDNRRPEQSSHRTRVWGDEVRLSFR